MKKKEITISKNDEDLITVHHSYFKKDSVDKHSMLIDIQKWVEKELNKLKHKKDG